MTKENFNWTEVFLTQNRNKKINSIVNKGKRRIYSCPTIDATAAGYQKLEKTIKIDEAKGKIKSWKGLKKWQEIFVTFYYTFCLPRKLLMVRKIVKSQTSYKFSTFILFSNFILFCFFCLCEIGGGQWKWWTHIYGAGKG